MSNHCRPRPYLRPGWLDWLIAVAFGVRVAVIAGAVAALAFSYAATDHHPDRQTITVTDAGGQP